MWSLITVSVTKRQHIKIERTRKWQPSVTAGSPPSIVSWRIRVSQAMAGQCAVFNSNISITYACLCHPFYPKIHAGLLKVWNTFLKQFVLRSQEELWHSIWELNSLLRGVTFKLGSIGDECYSCVSTKTNTAAKLLWMPDMAKEVSVCITGQTLDAGSPLWAHSSCSLCYGILLGFLSIPPALSHSLLLLALLVLLKPWHSGPPQPVPDGLTFHLMSVLGSQDTDAEGIWKRSNHQKNDAYLDSFTLHIRNSESDVAQ